MTFEEMPFRPPMEVNSVLVRGTQSCTWNKCKFCYMSQGYKFKYATLEYMENEILEQIKYIPPSPSIFIIGSNPFTLPFDVLKGYADLLRKYFPDFTEISMHSRLSDVHKKTDKELYDLYGLGFRHLYIGTESGNDEALSIMNKGHNVDQACEVLTRLDTVGIQYTCQYIIGMAGKGKGLESGKTTAQFINRIHARRVMSTGLTSFSGSELPGMIARGEFVEASEKEKLEEMLIFFETLTANIFFEGIHYLNPLRYRFQTSNIKNKKNVIEEIKNYLNKYSEKELDEMVNRKAMYTL